MKSQIILGLLLVSGLAHAEELVFVHAKVLPVEGQPIADGVVIVRDGKIDFVGPQTTIPAGAKVIDGKGGWLTPGLIAAPTQIGVVEISMVEGANDGSYPSADPIRASLRMSDALDPRSSLVPVARAHGITSAVVTPAGGLIEGQSVWMNLGSHWPAKLEGLAMHAALGEPGAAAVAGSRALGMSTLREVFDDARVYARQRDAFERNALRQLAASRLDLEALGPVLQGKMPLVLKVARAADIEAALAFLKEQKIRGVLVGAEEAWMVADSLAAAQVPVLVNPFDNIPGTIESRNARADNAAILASKGVLVGITTGDSHNARVLRQALGNAVRAGLPHEQALAAGTLNIAKAFGVDGEFGSLRKGKVANLVLWSGDPFEAKSAATKVVIDGELVSLETRQTRLRDKYLRRLGLPR